MRQRRDIAARADNSALGNRQSTIMRSALGQSEQGMKEFRKQLGDMFAPRTLLLIIYVLTAVVALKAISVYYGFSWLQALAAQ